MKENRDESSQLQKLSWYSVVHYCVHRDYNTLSNFYLHHCSVLRYTEVSGQKISKERSRWHSWFKRP